MTINLNETERLLLTTLLSRRINDCNEILGKPELTAAKFWDSQRDLAVRLMDKVGLKT